MCPYKTDRSQSGKGAPNLLRRPARGSAAGRPARRAARGGPPHRVAAAPLPAAQQGAGPVLGCPPGPCRPQLAWPCIAIGRSGGQASLHDCLTRAGWYLGQSIHCMAHAAACLPLLQAEAEAHFSPELSTSYNSDLRSAAGSPAARSAAFLPSLAAPYSGKQAGLPGNHGGMMPLQAARWAPHAWALAEPLGAGSALQPDSLLAPQPRKQLLQLGQRPAHRAIHKDCGLQQRSPQAGGRPRPRLGQVDAGSCGGQELAGLKQHPCGSDSSGAFGDRWRGGMSQTCGQVGSYLQADRQGRFVQNRAAPPTCPRQHCWQQRHLSPLATQR